MIEVKKLSKNYGQRMAIQDLNFSIQKGEIVGLLGPNGAGKTTTMKIITGFMPASSGCVVVDGWDVFEHPIKVKQKIGYLPEIPPVYGDMKVSKYLEFVASIRGMPRARVKSQTLKTIELMHLEKVAGRRIGNLSKGFRQRIGVAQALVTEPEVLVLDEPTVGLDPKQMAEIRKLILELKGQQTVILSTHILSEVQATCERVIIINKGQIVATDSLEGLSRRASGQSLVVLKVREPERLSFEEIGVQMVSRTQNQFLLEAPEDMVETIAQHVIQSKAGLVEISSRGSNLEDIFIHLTKE